MLLARVYVISAEKWERKWQTVRPDEGRGENRLSSERFAQGCDGATVRSWPLVFCGPRGLGCWNLVERKGKTLFLLLHIIISRWLAVLWVWWLSFFWSDGWAVWQIEIEWRYASAALDFVSLFHPFLPTSLQSTISLNSFKMSTVKTVHKNIPYKNNSLKFFYSRNGFFCLVNKNIPY